MIQLNAAYRSPVNFSIEKPLRPSHPLSAQVPKLTRTCWPFTATARFTVVASGTLQDSVVTCQPVSSFIT
jgi:hypothetical protein